MAVVEILPESTEYGIYVEPPTLNGNETQLSQIFGVKFDGVEAGVYIGSGSQKTQVFGVTREAGSQVVNNGVDSLLVTHSVDTGYPDSALVLTQQQSSQFNLSVNVLGTLDAAVKDAAGAGVRTYQTEDYGLTRDILDIKYGPTLAGFVGVYYDNDPQNQGSFLVAKSRGVWHAIKLTQV